MTRSKLLPTALLSLALLAVVALSAAYQQMARPAFSYTEALYVTDSEARDVANQLIGVRA